MNPEAIKMLRAKLGLTQAELGEMVGRSNTSISDWERGIVRPDRAAVIIMRSMI